MDKHEFIGLFQLKPWGQKMIQFKCMFNLNSHSVCFKTYISARLISFLNIIIASKFVLVKPLAIQESVSSFALWID